MTNKEEFDFAEPDKFRLDHECVRQPKLVMDYGLKLADAKAEQSRAKAALAVVEAELDRDIRSNPEDFGLEKLSEPAIARAMVLQPRHKKAVERYIVASHGVDVLKDAAMESLRHKKSSIEGLLQLHFAQYYAEPKTEDVSLKEHIHNTKTKEIRQRGQKKA